MSKHKSPGGDRWQTWKVIVVFLLAVLALMAVQFGATAVHQARWQLFSR